MTSAVAAMGSAPLARDASEGSDWPDAREGSDWPDAREGSDWPDAREGSDWPDAREGSDWPDGLFLDPHAEAELQVDDGRSLNLDCGGWHRRPDRADRLVLARCRGPVLDIGCGPGRHVTALEERGLPAMGIDTSSAAVAAARRRGATAVQTSVFGPVPDPGRWGTALLLDGNIGIGGDVTALLLRTRSLLQPGGRLLVETISPLARPGQAQVRVRHPGGASGWFPWAWATPADIECRSGEAGMILDEVLHAHGRWFVRLHTTEARLDATETRLDSTETIGGESRVEP
jgi:SAM-dependent methyltransferase